LYEKLVTVDHNKIEICRKYADGLVLDIGCFSRLYEKFIRGFYIGLDMHVFDKQKKPDVIGDARHLPFKVGSADTILAFDIIEHLPRDNLFASECNTVLKKGGKMFITTPNGPRSPVSQSDPSHISIYTKKEIGDLLESQGFKVQFEMRMMIHSLPLRLVQKLFPKSLVEPLVSMFLWTMFVVAEKK
jgi:SAM-dependent methyltransferase